MDHRTSETPDQPEPDQASDPLAPDAGGLPADQAEVEVVNGDNMAGESDSSTPNEDNDGQMNPPGILAGMGKMILDTGPVALPLRGIGRAFQALEHVDYRYIWIGAMLSNMGMWIQTVAIQWQIKTLAPTSSALWLGKFAFYQQIPTVLLLPLGGVLADRLDRRWIILTGNIFLAMLALSLAFFSAYGEMHVWHFIGVGALLGLTSSSLIPANQSLMPTLVSKKNLPNAVALNAMQFNLSRAIGPAIGGVVLVSMGAAWSFGINAFSYIFIVAAILLIQKPSASTRKHENVFQSMAGGAKYLRHRKDLRLMLLVVFFSGLLAAPVMSMLPAIVEELFSNTPRQFSQLLSSFGIGAVCGAALLALRSHKLASPWRGFITMGLFGVLEFTLSFQSHFIVAVLLVFFCGMAFVGTLNRFFAASLGSIPNHIRGRVASFHVLSLMLGFPLGSMIAGRIGATYGMVPVLRYFGLALAIILCIAGLYIWKADLKFIAHDTSEGSLEESKPA